MTICKVEGCTKTIEPNRTTKTCGMHRSRWQKHKSYDLPEREMLPEGIIKNCIHHGYLKKDQVRYHERKGRNYPQIRCKQCDFICSKKSNNNNRERVRKGDNAHYAKTRLRHLEIRRFSKFGITPEQFNKMLKKQNYVCKICKNSETALWKKRNEVKPLSIDHDHKTGKVRGLLCGRCNSALGLVKDSTYILESAMEYLKAHQ